VFFEEEWNVEWEKMYEVAFARVKKGRERSEENGSLEAVVQTVSKK